jgi:acyl carrier protein
VVISTRTPEGQPGRCPVCQNDVTVEPSLLFGDATCPNCGTLLWILKRSSDTWMFERESIQPIRDQMIDRIAEQLGVERDRVTGDLRVLSELGANSLDLVEFVMEWEEEFEQLEPPEDIRQAEPCTRT